MEKRKVQEISSTPFEHGGAMDISGVMTVNKPTQSYVTVRFYTKVAASLLFSVKNENGNKHNRFVIGVDWFDTKLSPLFSSIRADDPFADQMLVDIEESIDSAGNDFKTKQEQVRFLITNQLKLGDASIEFSDNGHSSECKVSFNNRLAYSFLWLAKELDNYMYYLHLADKYNAIDPAQYTEAWNEAKRTFRRTLGVINGWKSTSITRVDLAQNTARVPVAFKLNSAVNLSQEVLLLDKRASTAPRIDDWKSGQLTEQIKEMLTSHYC